MLDGYFSLCILKTANNEIPFNTVKFLPDAEATLNRYLNFGNPNQTKHDNKRKTGFINQSQHSL